MQACGVRRQQRARKGWFQMTNRQSVVDQARSEQARPSSAQCAQSAVRRVVFVVLLFGLVSCFGDIVYEGARSANGQYFSLLGASATMMGILYGTGEFLGYALRLVSGRICDFASAAQPTASSTWSTVWASLPAAVSWAFSTIIGDRRGSGLAFWSSKPQPSCSSSDSTGGRSDAPPVSHAERLRTH